MALKSTVFKVALTIADMNRNYYQDHALTLARVLKPQGRLFHDTGTPNMLTSGRNVPNEVSKRRQRAGFQTELVGDGVLARCQGQARGRR